MELVAFVGNDKETWGQVSALINRGEWEKVILVRNKTTEGFPVSDGIEEIKVDTQQSLMDLKNTLLDKLKAKTKGDFEVALSIASGNGKEHMALISSLLSIPVGIKLVAFTKKGVEFVN